MRKSELVQLRTLVRWWQDLSLVYGNTGIISKQLPKPFFCSKNLCAREMRVCAINCCLSKGRNPNTVKVPATFLHGLPLVPIYPHKLWLGRDQGVVLAKHSMACYHSHPTPHPRTAPQGSKSVATHSRQVYISKQRTRHVGWEKPELPGCPRALEGQKQRCPHFPSNDSCQFWMHLRSSLGKSFVCPGRSFHVLIL